MKRPVVVAVRLTEQEAALVDKARGPLTRSAWLRLLLLEREKTMRKPPRMPPGDDPRSGDEIPSLLR